MSRSQPPIGWSPDDSRPYPGWRSRGYLPHGDGAKVQFITYRVGDSLPKSVTDGWADELIRLPDGERRQEIEKRANAYLDRGAGECPLRRPELAKIVEESLLHHDGERYRLLEWVVMPNHVHVLVEPSGTNLLGTILQSWKGFTAKEINRVLERTGAFWAREYYDRFIRDDNHYGNVKGYIHRNPVKAGLCSTPDAWPFSSAARAVSERPSAGWKAGGPGQVSEGLR